MLPTPPVSDSPFMGSAPAGLMGGCTLITTGDAATVTLPTFLPMPGTPLSQATKVWKSPDPPLPHQIEILDRQRCANSNLATIFE